MAFDSATLSLFVVAAPLITLAGSAVAYVVKLFLDSGERRRKQFFELMQFIDSQAPIATKAAAVYELRQFPQHREFIIRFCESQRSNIVGGGAHILQQEFDATKAYMQALKN